MALKQTIYSPYFNITEKLIVYSALDEAADYLRRFYCFSSREWFNYCYDLKTELEVCIDRPHGNVFAEVRKYTPALKNSSAFPEERYQICLFDRNILKALWKQSGLEFYPFMVYILTHELIHVARFCQKLHPFECDEIALEKEEEKVNKLTHQVLTIRKNSAFHKVSSMYDKRGRTPLSPRHPILV